MEQLRVLMGVSGVVLSLACGALAEPGSEKLEEGSGLGGGPVRTDYAKRLIARTIPRETVTTPHAASDPRGHPGASSRHGVGNVTVVIGADPVTLTVFASRLTYSGRVRATIVPDTRAQSVALGLVDAFEWFGGVPASVELNAPTGCADLHEDGRTAWDATLFGLATESGVRLRANWVEPFTDDPLVFVEDSFFARFGFGFQSLTDLERKLAAWHRWANAEHRTEGETPDVRHARERPRLRALKIRRGSVGTLTWGR